MVGDSKPRFFFCFCLGWGGGKKKTNPPPLFGGSRGVGGGRGVGLGGGKPKHTLPQQQKPWGGVVGLWVVFLGVCAVAGGARTPLQMRWFGPKQISVGFWFSDDGASETQKSALPTKNKGNFS